MIVSKIALVPGRLLFGSARLTARAGYKTAKAGIRTAAGSARMGYVAGRAVGYGRTAVFGSGVVVGVLVASPRARAGVVRIGSTVWSIRQRQKGPSDGEITGQVQRRLAGAQATWDLPQPTVTVHDGRVRLDGDAPDARGRRAIGEAASAVDGVREVDNRLVVTATADPAPGTPGVIRGEGAPDDADFESSAGNGAHAPTAGGRSPRAG